MEGALIENAEGAEGVSEGGLAKEKLEAPDPKGVVVARENTEGADGADVAQVDGTEKVKLDDDDDTGAVGAMLNGAAEAAGAGRMEAAAEVRPRFANAAGADVVEAAILGGWVAKEPMNRNEMIKTIIYTSKCLKPVGE